MFSLLTEKELTKMGESLMRSSKKVPSGTKTDGAHPNPLSRGSRISQRPVTMPVAKRAETRSADEKDAEKTKNAIAAKPTV